MSQVILFDLDGTLTESGEGITRCVQYALNKLGIEETDLDKLRCFIGPPLKEQFMEYAGLSQESAQMAVSYYRERYTEKGMFENRLYDKIPDLLEVLKINDKILGVATSKPEQYAKQILEHFNIAQYFQVIVGSNMDGSRTEKVEVIEEALVRLKMDKERDKVIMVGDREHDVSGAKSCGLQCIGVSYGYGTRKELEEAGAVYIADSVEDLGILASPNDEETFEHVESVRKSESKSGEETAGEHEETKVEEKKEPEITICRPQQPEIHPLKKIWRSFYPILIYLLLTEFVRAIAYLYFDWSTGNTQAIVNPLDIMKKMVDTSVIQIMISSLSTGIICFFLYRKDQRERKEGFLGQGPDFVWSPPVLWFSIIVLAVAGSQLLNDLINITHLAAVFPGYTDASTQVMNGQPIWLLLLVIGLITPIAEELVFRGLVFRRMKDWMRPGMAILMSSLVFGIYHGNIVQFVFASILGIFLAFVYNCTGTLWAAILVHSVVNIWSLVGSEFWGYMWSKVPFGMAVSMVLEMLICVIPLYLLYISNKKRNSKIINENSRQAKGEE